MRVDESEHLTNYGMQRPSAIRAQPRISQRSPPRRRWSAQYWALGLRLLLFCPLAFALIMGLDLDLLPLGSTAASGCPLPVDDSGAFTDANVALDWLIVENARGDETPDPLL